MIGNSVIHFDNVSLAFGQQFALQNVSFDVQAGVVFALLGENGAGKTTSIKTILGMATPDRGQVTVLGMHPMARSFDVRRQIGYVPEQSSLYDWMTVKEVGWFAAGFYPPGYETEYQRLANNFALPLGKKISSLSKGMRAKVVLALAMAHQPPLLLLDEPTSGLDTLVRREFLESMVELTAAGQTVFLSSHQIPEVERVADVVAIMKQGQLLLVEEISQLKESSLEVIITYEDQVNLTALPGNVVHHSVQGRQCACLIRTDNEEQFYRLQDRPEIRTVDVRRPSLEDIFVAYMHADRVPPTSQVLVQQSEMVR
jgi:ABC-2 type transport system ATP-binding protein